MRSYFRFLLANIFILYFGCPILSQSDSLVYRSLISMAKLPVVLGNKEDVDDRVLKQCERAIDNEQEIVRYQVYQTISKIAILTNSQVVKKKALNLLLRSAEDSSFAIRKGFHLSFRHFEKSAFDERFKSSLVRMIHDEKTVNKGLILLVGYLDLHSESDFIKNTYIGSTKKLRNEFTVNNPFNTIEFSARLCAAKLGDNESLKYILNKIDSLPDDLVVLERFDDLSYLRNSASNSIILKYLNSNGKLPKVDNCQESYANRALHVLAGIFIDFPVEKKAMPFYSSEELSISREWASRNVEEFKIELNKW